MKESTADAVLFVCRDEGIYRAFWTSGCAFFSQKSEIYVDFWSVEKCKRLFAPIQVSFLYSGQGISSVFLGRVRKKSVSVTVSVRSSAAGVASQSPVIFHRYEKR